VDAVIALIAAAVVLVLGARVQFWDLADSPDIHLDRHVRGFRYADAVRSRIGAQGAPAVLDAAQAHPTQRVDLLRVPGWVLGDPRDAGSWWAAARSGAAALPTGARALYWEGAGEALFPQHPGGAPQSAALSAVLAQVGLELDGCDAARLAFGIGFGAPHRGLDTCAWSSVMSELPRSARPAMCAGRGALEMDRRHDLFGTDLETLAQGVPGCDPAALAVGLGLQLARETLPDRPWPGGAPDLDDWLAEPLEPEQRAAGECAYRTESEFLGGLAGGDWRELDGSSTLERCL